MSARLPASIVRIFTTSGEIVGAGFLVTGKYILTCAHVVAQALGIPADTTNRPAEVICLDFPLVARGKMLTARVVFWQPLQSSSAISGAEGEDIAGLELQSAPPDVAQPVQLMPAEDLWGHTFRVFGFPSGHNDGVWASGVLRGQQASGWVQIEDVKEAGYRVEPGFSGAPVWDEQLKGVAGMAVAAERGRVEVKAAFIIPAHVLVKIWPSKLQTVKEAQSAPDQAVTQRRRVFISYKRSVVPDETVALAVFQALSQQHEVFIDQTMTVGTRWAERIETEIRSADFLISFLSDWSVRSEMVVAEIETAYHHAKAHGGHPAILPVRLAYREPFEYPLSAYLNGINWAFWQGEGDTPRLIAELQQAIAGSELNIGAVESKAELIEVSEPPQFPQPSPAAQPVGRSLPLEMPEGTMDGESAFYVERPSDPLALAAIAQKGVTITIKGPRQMGKSSLLIRTMAAAVNVGKRVAFLDFQLFGKAALSNADSFFRQFCSWLTDELEMADKVDEYWQTPLGNSQRCTRYVGRYLLRELGSPLVLAMDEVESVFDTDFRSDFFGMLRSWHNSRATTPLWKQLDLALVTSTEPYQLIEDLNQSPFNVGQVIDLPDFMPEQVADLNQRHGKPLNSAEERQLMALLGGHPYLVRKALYLVASQRISASDLFSNATDDRGPFGDHLRYHLFRMHGKQELVQGFLQSIRQNICQDELVFFRLRGAGLVRREGRAVLPRCQLYADYFREHLHV